MNVQTTIILTTGVALILIIYTLVILINASRYILGKVRGGILMQLFGLLMVALGFLWGALSIMLQWQQNLFWQQIFLFVGILFMFFAARRLFSTHKTEENSVPASTLPSALPRAGSGFALLLISAGLILALSAPFSSGARAVGQQASTLESIQQQIDNILIAILKIQQRIAELFAQQAAPEVEDPIAVEEPIVSDEPATPTVDVEEVSIEEVSAVVYPLWKFIPLPSTELAVNLAVLYRLSITAGDKDATVSSIIYTINYGDVSIKDLSIHAFTDVFFSKKAYDNSAKNDIIGKRNGFISSGGQTFAIALESYGAGVIVPAGKTYYFELRGVPLGKNISAFATISAEGLPEVTLN
jgi:hypothetical protein